MSENICFQLGMEDIGESIDMKGNGTASNDYCKIDVRAFKFDEKVG